MAAINKLTNPERGVNRRTVRGMFIFMGVMSNALLKLQIIRTAEKQKTRDASAPRVPCNV